MKKTILLIPLLYCLWTFGQTPSNDPHWQLIWQDEFNTLNTNIWEVANNFDHYGEPQVYKTNNTSVLNGNLVIKVKKEAYSCPAGSINQWECVRQYNTGQQYSYTSGWVETKQAYNTQYGYIESRIKLPYGYGFWPAFWTFVGSGVSGSNAAEIDIFEMLGGGQFGSPNIMTTNLHTEYPDIVNKFQSLTPTGFNYTTYHTYGIEWSPSKIIWYVDGSPVRLFPNHGIIDPVRIILNLAIQPDYLPNSSTPFPSDMLVDYVKVYDLKKDCSNDLNVCNYNFGTYDNKVKKSITIGNGSCTNSLNVGQNIFLRASEGVLINGDFTVPIGSELYIDVNPCY
jgi:beta-glucanase (GH16 family)